MPGATLQPRPRRRNPIATREDILNAARELAAERGPEAMTISEVAHRAGVNRGTLYQHFRGRDELADAVMVSFTDELTAMLTSESPVGERIDLFLSFFADHPEFVRLWTFDLLNNGDASPSASWSAFIETLDGLAESERGAPGIDTESLGRILIGAPLFWALWVQKAAPNPEDRRSAVERFSAEMKRMLLFGVMNPDHYPVMAAEVADGHD